MELAQHHSTEKIEVEKRLDKLMWWDFGWYYIIEGDSNLYPKFETKIPETLPDGT